ncbi:hypothetical protein EIKCOROL_01971 [Eikenella corrodens ATCC 23834]|uniref:Uncharacterized protein n=1 Tax=Eikenella corrodens ATCC 23834 TaxID=546274 RepID=C0DX67_EIKCO|nr:hypothetical protein EIKCOROL_01971 [Eikenella corrodens ATCC 23834]
MLGKRRGGAVWAAVLCGKYFSILPTNWHFVCTKLTQRHFLPAFQVAFRLWKKHML